MAELFKAPLDTTKYHVDLLNSYAISEDSVKNSIDQLRAVCADTHSIELKYLLAKASVFGNLVNIKWLYYHNQITESFLRDFANSNTPLYCQNYLYGIQQYADIVKSFGDQLDCEAKFEQYIAYELYRILNLSDDFRRILSIPSHDKFSNSIKVQLDDLKLVLLRLLGQVGYESILVDYNQYFLDKPEGVTAQQVITILQNYEVVISDSSIPLHIQDQAREALFYIYLKGKHGVQPDQNKAISYLNKSLDYSLLEAVGFDLYYGNNELLKINKEKAQGFFSRCFSNSEKVKSWSKINEPVWYAEFDRRSRALESFFSKH